jgi:hypothetical protein
VSVHVLSWVLKCSPVTDPQQRLVLLVLADHADDEGGGAFPKWETIAAESKVPKGTVGQKLRELRAAGHIEETGRTGYNNRTVVWRVVMGEAIRSFPADSQSDRSQRIPSDQSDGGPELSRVEASREPSEPSIAVRDGSGRERAARGWRLVLDHVSERDDLTEFQVETWLEPLKPLDASPGRLVLGAPEHVRGWVRDIHLPVLEEAAAAVAGRAVEIVLMPMLGEAAA